MIEYRIVELKSGGFVPQVRKQGDPWGTGVFKNTESVRPYLSYNREEQILRKYRTKDEAQEAIDQHKLYMEDIRMLS